MTTKTYNFYVGEAKNSYYSSGRFETYEEAEASARKQAYSNGETYLVFQAVATAAEPVEVNSVKVTKL